MLRLVASFAEIEASPVGCAVHGSSFLAWCATSRLVGTVHVRRRDTADARALTRLYALARHPALRTPLRRVVDGTALAGVDEEAWNQMATAVGPQLDALRGVFERQAVIVAPTIEGARTAALLPALGPTDSYRVFTKAEEAYRWADPIDGAVAHAAVTALCDELATLGDLDLRARGWIRTHLRGARLAACARALGVSTRSLQRSLAAAGATFRAVLAAERVAAARERLEGDAKVEAIARAVGCASASQLGALLRRAGLPSPARLRASSAKPR